MLVLAVLVLVARPRFSPLKSSGSQLSSMAGRVGVGIRPLRVLRSLLAGAAKQDDAHWEAFLEVAPWI